ncbi:NACHT domain-containing protein (plasmid) [Azospirillum argentinense]|uniref:NACHT domain-containing protein n=1 Tax=Azospirillum argentinense TaxID=2970906 RepID=A0A4D8PT99_9PROT|nr:NACHT domain-containing protein [Azospirillum argentinense]QCO00048.1 NACHT domain-containing protein [Azospirillum argentinense]
MSASLSTTERGNAFRDHICRLLVAAGFDEVTAEVRVDFKKADAVSEWAQDTLDGRLSYLIETKEYAGALPLKECSDFVSQYGSLIEEGRADRAWLISRGPISPDGRAQIEARRRRGLRCFTYAELQRHLLRLDGYLMDLVAMYEKKEVAQFYIRPHTADHADLEAQVREWIDRPSSAPLAIVGSYGQGKSTFALHLAATLAREAIADPTKRVPILVPLGEIVDDQSLDGLIGKVLASQHRAGNYHYHLFSALNDAGRFVVIYDALDEMKHGMTLPAFQRNMAKLLELDKSDSRVLILGRDTVFQSDIEFRAVILGRQTTAAGREVPSRGRRELEPVYLRGFTLEEARHYVSRYFPLKAREFAARAGTTADAAWIVRRIAELTDGHLDHLIVRPVHAQMLCEIAADPATDLGHVALFELYDTFIHYLLDREVSKAGRYAGFDIAVRRRFNASFAWWLWERGQASTTTFADAPIALCHAVTTDVLHDFDDEGLKRELTSGCLVEKGGSTVYFGHRSIQEFLVAEHLFDTNLLAEHGRSRVDHIWPLLNPVIADFLMERLSRDPAREQRARDWLAALEPWSETDLDPAGANLFVRLAALVGLAKEALWRSPWNVFLAFFVANGGPTFRPVTPQAHTLAEQLLRASLTKPLRLQAAVLYLWARIMDSPESDGPRAHLPMFLSYCLPLEELRTALHEVRKGRSFTHHVRQESAPGLWTFLKVTQVVRQDREMRVQFQLPVLVNVLEKIVGISFDGFDFGPDEWFCPAKGIYQALAERGLKSGEIDVVRTFLNEEDLRRRIRPLVVETGRLATGPAGSARPLLPPRSFRSKT